MYQVSIPLLLGFFVLGIVVGLLSPRAWGARPDLPPNPRRAAMRAYVDAWADGDGDYNKTAANIDLVYQRHEIVRRK